MTISATAGRLNVKNEELEDMVKEAPGPINFTVFLTMFGEKLKGEFFGAFGRYLAINLMTAISHQLAIIN